MEVNKRSDIRVQMETDFMKSWMPKMISVPIGLFHLSGQAKWGSIFVSDKCLEVFDCTTVDFLEKLMEIELLSLGSVPEKTVGMLLDKIKRTQASCAFVGVRQNDSGRLQYIRGTLEASPSADGRFRVYGQIMDISSAYEREADFPV